MSLKYKENLRVVITLLDENNTVFKYKELVTNSQDAFWHFIDGFQKQFIESRGVQTYPMTDDGEAFEIPLMLTEQQVFEIYENQDHFFGEDSRFVRLDLSDVGLFGFIWIMNDQKDFDDLFERFMDGEMEISTFDKYELIETII